MITFQKQPNEVLDYDFNFDEWFTEYEDDEIETVEVTILSGDDQLVLGPAGRAPTVLIGNPVRQVKIWVGGGTDGQRYKLRMMIHTEEGREKEVDIYFKIREV